MRNQFSLSLSFSLFCWKKILYLAFTFYFKWYRRKYLIAEIDGYINQWFRDILWYVVGKLSNIGNVLGAIIVNFKTQQHWECGCVRCKDLQFLQTLNFKTSSMKGIWVR